MYLTGCPRASGRRQEHSPSEHFGTAHLATSCSADVQPQFDRAVAMLHSFFFPETVKAFTAIAAAEPSCAMAYWGIAMSQRPNPLVPPFSKELLQAGWQAIEKARAANAPTQRERDWIEAVALFYEGYDTVDQKTRTARYERAMGNLHERYPDDTEIAVFYALALNEAVDLTDKAYYRQLKAAAILEPLAQTMPDHPGIAHLIIHSYDYAPIAARGLPAARRYAALAPSAPQRCTCRRTSFPRSACGARRSTLTWHPMLRRKRMRPVRRRSGQHCGESGALSLARFPDERVLAARTRQAREGDRRRAQLGDAVARRLSALRVTRRSRRFRCAMRSSEANGPRLLHWCRRRLPYPQAEAITWFGRALGAARSDDPAAARRNVAELARLRAKLAASNDDVLG